MHNDFSPDNTLISADGSRVGGIIDFGDVTVTALVNDVAIAVANLLPTTPTRSARRWISSPATTPSPRSPRPS